MNLSELVARCRADLVDIRENLRWAHADGYNATNATQSRDRQSIHVVDDEAPVEAAPIVLEESDPDKVKGPRFDLGIGDHQSRTAYRHSVDYLRRAEGYLAIAVWRLGAKHQPAIVRPVPSMHLGYLERCIAGNVVRLGMITDRAPTSTRRVDRQVENAARELDRAWHSLNHAFERGSIDPDSQAFADACRICGIRPNAPKSGGRCNTCYVWKQRNGFERPTTLDSVHDARLAKQRRIRRGDGWGDESLSATGG